KRAGTVDVITGGNDLVADVAAGRKSLGAVRDEELPDNVRTLGVEERKVFLDRQLAQRRALNERLASLVQKRDHYVLEQRKKAPQQPGRVGDSFDRAVETTLRAQIKR